MVNPATFSTDPGIDSVWFAVPNDTSPSTIMSSSIATSTTGDAQIITIGARVDYNLPATTVGDEYKNTILITATAKQYNPSAPTITKIEPNTGILDENTTVTITGTNLDTAHQVFVDLNGDGNQDSGEECANANITDPTDANTTITCDTPTATTDGSYDLVVKTWGGTDTLTNGFTYITAPAVTAIVPNIASTITPNGDGSGSNGPQFSIVGTNFGTDPTVTIGGQTCDEVTSNDAGTAITCSGPTTGMSTGNQVVVVTSGGQASNDNQVVAYNDTVYPTLQSLTSATCSTIPTVYRDTRDSQLYYVNKLADGKCWMLDNLRYKPNGDTTGTVTESFSATQVANTGSNLGYDVANYIDPISETTSGTGYCYNDTNKSTYNITKCGLLYNYYTATAGTYPQANFTTNGSFATGSICPANWHLPTGYNSDANFNDLAVLNGYMAGDGAPYQTSSTSDSKYYSGWQYSGAFAGVFSGNYGTSFSNQGVTGNLWSSSVYSASYGYNLYFNFSSLNVNPGTNYPSRNLGFGVRCVIDTKSAPPADYQTKTTAIVPNFASTVTPSGNGTARGKDGPQFSIHGSNFNQTPTVTIDGKPCTNITVNSAGTDMTCTGPTSGMSDGEKRVFINGTDAGDSYVVWYSSYDFPTLQSLTLATCQNLPLRLNGSGNASVYRDTRDSQLYYVARLADNKCWMLDNLKYKPNGDSTGTVTDNFSAEQVWSGYLTISGDYDTSNNYVDFNSPKYVDPIAETASGTGYCYNDATKSTYNITKCGLLYNFFTATAGADNTASGDQITSICPTNWKLPTGGANGDFGVLNGSMYAKRPANGSAISTTAYVQNWQYSGAFAGVFSGSYVSSFSSTQSGYGNFWSSSAISAGVSYRLVFSPTTVTVASNTYRHNGFGVRCVVGS
jgi:uncharacterized protein (TIGR02145 family)